MSSATPGMAVMAVSVWSRPTGRSGRPTSACAAPSRSVGVPSSRSATEVSRSDSGANSRAMSVKMPSPSRYTQSSGFHVSSRRSASANCSASSSPMQVISIDRLVTTKIRLGGEVGLPALDEGESRLTTRFGHVRPRPVEPMVAGGGRRDRVEAEELVQELAGHGVEGGHVVAPVVVLSPPSSPRESRKSQPRASPGSIRITTPR